MTYLILIPITLGLTIAATLWLLIHTIKYFNIYGIRNRHQNQLQRPKKEKAG